MYLLNLTKKLMLLKWTEQRDLNQRVVLDLSVVVDEHLLGGVVVERVDQLQAQDELVSLGPDVVHVLRVAVVQRLEKAKMNIFI